MRGVSHVKPGDVFADKFEIRELIGRGGMGVVYRAFHRYLDKEVAIKLVPLIARNASVDLKERFRKETAAMGKLKHANIVEVFDGGVIDDTAYIAMELMTGWNLRQLLLKGRLRHLQICLFLAQVSDALFCLHQNKILHRDIKPENLFVTMDLRVKVIDFGLARVRTASKYATQNPIPAGTPQYMAPEQLLNAPLDESVDIYALGMVAWEATTGKHPIAVATGMVADREEWIQRMMSGVPLPDLAEQGCGAPPALVSLVMRCLSFDPTRRPTAAAVSAALRELARELAEVPPSQGEPLSIEERLAALPSSTVSIDTPTLVDAISSSDAPTEEWTRITAPEGHRAKLAVSGTMSAAVPERELAATQEVRGPSTPLLTPPSATPLAQAAARGADLDTATSPMQRPLVTASPMTPPMHAARPTEVPPTPVMLPREAAPRVTATLATAAHAMGGRGTSQLAPHFTPPDPLARQRGARGTTPMQPVQLAHEAMHAPPSVPRELLPLHAMHTSSDEPALTPGPVASNAPSPSAPQRTRGVAFLGGLLTVGGLLAGHFVTRLHAAPVACDRGVVLAVQDLAAGTPSTASAPDVGSMPEALPAGHASADAVVAPPVAQVASTSISGRPSASAKPTPPPRGAPSAQPTSEVFDTW